MMTGTRTAPLTIRHHVILGVPVAALDAPSALAAIARLVEEAPPVHLVYVNAHTLNLASRDAAYRATLERATLILRDGAWIGLRNSLAIVVVSGSLIILQVGRPHRRFETSYWPASSYPPDAPSR